MAEPTDSTAGLLAEDNSYNFHDHIQENNENNMILKEPFKHLSARDSTENLDQLNQRLPREVILAKEDKCTTALETITVFDSTSSQTLPLIAANLNEYKPVYEHSQSFTK